MRTLDMVRLLLAAVGLGLGLTAAWAAGPDGQEDICTSPAVIFCDNFEARSLGFSDLVRSTYRNPGWAPSAFYSNLVVTETPAGVYHGRRALEFRYPAGGGGIAFIGTNFPVPYRTLYFRWYQKWSVAFEFSPIATKGAIISTSRVGQSLYPWWSNWGDGALSLWANNVAAEFEANVNGAFVPARDRWYCLELRVTMNTGTQADGYVQGWIDGVQRWDYPNVLLDPLQPNDMTALILSGYWNCLTADCQAPQDQHPLMHRWHDNVVVSTERIGCLAGTAQPTIADVTPPSGSTAGGTTVDIIGSGFTDESVVQIAGVNATDVVVNNPGWIRAVTPPAPAGAASVTVSQGGETAVRPAGFVYLAPETVLLEDDFADGAADGWTISPLGNAAGWRVAGQAYTYDGGNHTQSHRGEPFWSDYALEVKVRLATLDDFPGGIRGRVNGATGAGYEIWLFPATREISLVRATAWHIDSPGLTQLGRAGGIDFGVGTPHTLRLTFTDSVIDVHFDEALVIRAADTAYRSGGIALDGSTQPIEFDDVVVRTLP